MFRYYSSLMVVILLCANCRADVNVGVGITSVLGRGIPALAGAYLGEGWALSGSTTGVQTKIYYESAYTLALYQTWKAGDFFWGPLNAGFGLGTGYSQRGYRSDPTIKAENETDFNLGPAFRLSWHFLGSVNLSLETVWGLGMSSLGMNAQDNVICSLGVDI